MFVEKKVISLSHYCPLKYTKMGGRSNFRLKEICLQRLRITCQSIDLIQERRKENPINF